MRLTTKVAATVIALFALAQGVHGQSPVDDLSDRRPEFLLASITGAPPMRIDITHTPILRRRIAVNFDGVTMEEALRVISRLAGLELAYSKGVVPLDRRVRLNASDITVAAALTEVLLDANVDVLFSTAGDAVLVGRSPLVNSAPRQFGSVAGRVSDAKTKLPIASAMVLLEGTRLRATTGDSGQFRLTSVPPATYTLSVRRLGYEKLSRTVAVATDQQMTVSVALQRSARVLEQVVVTGSVIETERKALPTPISVVSAEDIERKGITRVDQLFHGEIPGVWALPQQSGDQTRGAGLYVRGSADVSNPTPTGNAIKTYIDGVEMYDPHFVMLLDPSTIDHIEIVRGPQASTIYGANALYGVMQIFTKHGRPTDPPQLEATIAAGTLEGQLTDVLTSPESPHGVTSQMDHGLAVSGASGQLTYRVGGHFHYDGPWQEGASLKRWDGSAGATFAQGPIRVSSSIHLGLSKYKYPTVGFVAENALTGVFTFPGAVNFLPAYSNEQPVQTIGATVQYQAAANWHHTLTVGQDRNSWEYIYSPFTISGAPADSFARVRNQKQTRSSVSYVTTATQSLGRTATLAATAGADHWDAASEAYMASSLSVIGNLAVSPTISRLRDHNNGYFTQLQLGLGDAFFVIVGIRAEANPNFGTKHSIDYAPRGGLSYVHNFGNVTLKGRASYGRAISPPTIGQKSQVLSSATSIVLANPSLKPAVQRGGDVGFELYSGDIASLDVTYYHQKTQDLITNVALAPTAQFQFVSQNQNLGLVENKGWEMDGRLMPIARLAVHATYTLMDSHVIELGVPPGAFWPYHSGEQLRGAPHSTGALSLAYVDSRTFAELAAEHTGQALTSDFGLFYNGLYLRLKPPALSFTGIASMPAYTQFHARLSHSLTPRATVFAQVNNLTNKIASGYWVGSTTLGRSTLFGLRLK